LTGGDVRDPSVRRGLDLAKVHKVGGADLTTRDNGQEVRRLTTAEGDSDRLTLNDSSRRLYGRLSDDASNHGKNS